MKKYRMLWVVVLACVMVFCFSALALAEPVTMGDALEGAATDIAGQLMPVAIAAVAILVIFLAWRLGKKLFKSVAS
ncbi:hypothetical protein KO465_06265 [Candidatus Micrarchaeota archaeon]|jgi:Na+/proline symporter|nr:hypothetical protein [Candidatus Micrarchaeota archaeon]